MRSPTWAGEAPFCGREHGGRVDEVGAHVARHLQLDGAQPGRRAQRVEGAEAAVGGRRPAEADDDPPGALLEGPVDELAGAGRRRLQDVVAVGTAGELQPAGPGHLDDGGALGHPPRRLHRRAERAGHARGPVGSAEDVEQPLAAVRHRQLVGVVAALPAGAADGRARLGRRRRPAELVQRGDDPHRRGKVTRSARAASCPTGPGGMIAPRARSDSRSAGRVSAMAVTVRIPTTLRPMSGGASTVEVPAGTLSRRHQGARRRPPGLPGPPARRRRQPAQVRQRVRRRRRRALPRRPGHRGPRRPVGVDHPGRRRRLTSRRPAC